MHSANCWETYSGVRKQQYFFQRQIHRIQGRAISKKFINNEPQINSQLEHAMKNRAIDCSLKAWIIHNNL